MRYGRVRHSHDAKCVSRWIAQLNKDVAVFGLVLWRHVGSVVEVKFVRVDGHGVFVGTDGGLDADGTAASCA